MYNNNKIVSCLEGLVGFGSTYNSEVPDISTDLQASSSGIVVNDLHPLLSYENILAIAENFSKTQVNIYATTTTYNKGAIVDNGTDFYYSLVDSNINQVLTDAAKWRKTTLLSAFLRRTYTTSVIKLFSQLFTQKKLSEVAKTLLGQVSIYEGVGNITGRITKVGRMVGYKITVKHPDTAATLSHIGLQLDTVQADVKVYLYHSSSNVPVKIFTIIHTKSIQFEWHEIAKEVLNYMNDTISAGGAYYLTYYQNEMTGEAIKKDYSFGSRGSCSSCSEQIINQRLFNNWSKYISIEPFYINSDDVNVDRSIWNHDREIYADDTTWGLNLQLSIQCDVSDLVCRNKNVLADALSKQIVVDLLTAMTYSLRDNQKKERIAGLAAIALDNSDNHQEGEAKKLRNAITALSFDLSSMSDACLPCNSNQGFKLKSVWNG